MAQKTYAGVTLEVTEDGYLVDSTKWNEEIAKEIAKEEGIELTDKHFAVLKYIRENQAGLTIRKVGKSGIVDIKGFYDLFPGGPLKLSSKIAGINKPTSCV
ncbi:MAG: sulfur relay protein DsrC [Bacteroidetes bacterium GWC2_33_15]|nr:MAG: sulfur relay protein DsrC [Bacteroidetes bacterium GWA2_33_15]OFX49353.1 MAG: sulfur relay protein DsrC [Bacteroidetes bacterium GWC2_33_15]OFX63054.1 MAG: sulfur relay protein DsrC [Bacteroidetes bacterium GWB2_32_14]OFX68701.1 MAG: sulfur relay protein DsrC [Bacteroidetes bacterium GWD2_33_33]HAN19132.1 sulfur relay protein DsrC [Bacteroidales bacterium]